MQIFNEINSRKLGIHEYNVFAGFFNNFLFLGIIVGTVIVQVTLVQFGGVPVRTCPLTWKQHAMCLAIGMFSLVQGVIVKIFLPVSWFEFVKMKEQPMTDKEEKGSLVSTFRKSFRESVKRQNSQGGSVKDTTPLMT